MKRLAALALLFASTLCAAAPDTLMTNSRVRFMAANCAYCHGPDGKSRGAIPSLAGMDKRYFVEKMKGFRDGTRPSTIMSSHASGYTDAEFAALGTWFSNHK